MPNPVVVDGITIDPDELQAAFISVRRHADASNYGRFISDDQCRLLAGDIVAAVEKYRQGKTI